MFNKIGMRSIKSAIAVFIGLVVCLHFDLEGPSIVIGAIMVAMAPSIYDTLQASIFRTLATVFGIILATIFQLIGFANPFSGAIGVLLIIVLSNHFKIQKVIFLSTIIFTYVLTYQYESVDQLYNYATNRFLDTIIGAFIGFIVNISIFKPRQENFLDGKYKDMIDTLEKKYLAIIIDRKIDEDVLIDKLYAMEETYRQLKNDSKFRVRKSKDEMSYHDINNKFRLATSTLIELDQMPYKYYLNEQSIKMVNDYFQSPVANLVEHIDSPETTKYAIVYNYETQRLIMILKSLKKALNKE